VGKKGWAWVSDVNESGWTAGEEQKAVGSKRSAQWKGQCKIQNPKLPLSSEGVKKSS
jgi:hypothetical protein